MVARLVRQRAHNLLQKCERLVDEARLLQSSALAVCLLQSLGAREVHQMKLRTRDLLARLDSTSAVDVDGEDGVTSARRFVECVLGEGLLGIPLEKDVQSHLLAGSLLHHQLTAYDFPLGPFLHQEVALLVLHRRPRQQIEHQLVVDFDVRQSDADDVLWPGMDFSEGPRDRSRYKPSLGEAVAAANGEGLTGARLAVGKHRAVVALHDAAYYLVARRAKHGLLRRVHYQLVDLEMPVFGGVVDSAVACVSGVDDVNSIGALVELVHIAREVGRRPHSHDHLHLARHPGSGPIPSLGPPSPRPSDKTFY
mmetsp:Transcript_12063/g.29220  ORF Transcript_12063/g.29220 Transcript_12063/m.29220 type:complete len:309 (+) Transcript_12063:2006-2932(+)